MGGSIRVSEDVCSEWRLLMILAEVVTASCERAVNGRERAGK